MKKIEEYKKDPVLFFTEVLEMKVTASDAHVLDAMHYAFNKTVFGRNPRWILNMLVERGMYSLN